MAKKYSTQLQDLLKSVDELGGLSRDTSDELLKHSKDFREDFTLEQLASIERGLADIEAGRIISQEKMAQNFSRLRDNLNKSKS